MALKFPGMNKGNSPSTPAVKPAKSAKSGSSLFGFLSKAKKPALSAAGTQPGGESTGSGFGQTGDQTRKIKAEVAAAKVTKAKKEMGAFKVPMIGHLPAERQLQILLIVAGVFGALTVLAIVFDGISRSNLSTYTNITSQLQFHTQRLAKSAGLAARGDAVSFPQLQDSRDEFQRYLDVLNNGGEAFNANVP